MMTKFLLLLTFVKVLSIFLATIKKKKYQKQQVVPQRLNNEIQLQFSYVNFYLSDCHD